MTRITKLLSIMNRRILTLIKITVRGNELRPRKTTTNYGYAFVGITRRCYDGLLLIIDDVSDEYSRGYSEL